MATIVAAAGGGNFTAGGTWIGGIAPTAADDAQLTATSGAVTVDAGSVCRSLDCTGYTALLTISNSVTALAVGDGSGGALKFASTHTIATSGNSTITFKATSDNGGAGWGITSAGLTMPSMTFNGVGGKWVFQDNMTGNSVCDFTITNGTLDTNSKTININRFLSSGSATRTLTMGSSAITVNLAGLAWSFATITGLTITANTATVTLTGAGGTFTGATSTNWNGLSVVLNGGGAMAVNGTSSTFNNITVTGTAVATDTFTMSSQTMTGQISVTGQSVTNRVLCGSGLLGGLRVWTAATDSFANVDFQDIQAAGAAAPFTGTSIGDCGGNVSINCDPPVTQTWSGTGGGNWSANAWTTRVPLPQDDVKFTSAFTNVSITMDMPRIGKNIDWTGSSGRVSSWARGSGITNTNYGSLTLTPTVAVWGLVNGGQTLAGRGNFTLNTNGVTATTPLIVSATNGTYTLASNLTAPNSFTVVGGTFNTGNFNISSGSPFGGSGTPTVNLGSSTITLTGTGNVLSIGSGVILNAQNSTIVVANTSVLNKTMSLFATNRTFNNLTITGGGTGSFTFIGNCTYDVITINSPTNIFFTNGSITTCDYLIANGTADDIIWRSTVNNYAAKINVLKGYSVSNVDLRDSDASGSMVT